MCIGAYGTTYRATFRARRRSSAPVGYALRHRRRKRRADGRSPERAFRTLQKAITAARHAVGVRTIVCGGVAQDDADLDFVNFPLDRELTIVGEGLGLHRRWSGRCERHARPACSQQGHDSRLRADTGVHISACRDVTLSHTRISAPTGRRAVVVDGNSNVSILDCSAGTSPDRQVPLDAQSVQRSPGSLVRVVQG
jgi:hypothetical protein